MNLRIKFNSEYIYLLKMVEQSAKKQPLSYHELNLVGSRKSGKTYQAMLLVALMMMNSKIIVLFTRNISLKITDTYQQFFAICRECGLPISNVNINKKIQFSNGSLALFRSFRTQQSDERKLTGLPSFNSYDYVVSFRDEISECDLEDIHFLNEAIRGDKLGSYIKINTSNPWLESHWYINKCSKVMPFKANILMKKKSQFLEKDGVVHHYTNMYQNLGFLSPREVNELEDTIGLDQLRAKIVVFGMPGIAQGTIYYHLLHKIKNKLDFVPFEFSIGVDYGEKRDKTTWSLWATDRDYKRFICLESCEHDNTTQQYLDSFGLAFKICNTLKRWIREYPLLGQIGCELFYDNANLSFGQMINSKLYQMNITQIACLESVKILILLRVGQWKTIMGLGNFYITSKANELFRELQSSIWDPTSAAKYKRIDKDDHHINSGEYALQKWLGNEELSL